MDTPSEDSAGSADEYALQVAERLREAFSFMRQHTGKQTDRMRSNYDAAIKPRSFQEESYVLLYVPKKKRAVYAKWNVCWIGPYKVIRKINQHNYVLKKSPKGKEIVVHADRLKHYFAELTGTAWAKDAAQSADVQDQCVADENARLRSATTASQQPLQSSANAPCAQPVADATAGRPLRQHTRPARYLQVVAARPCSSCTCISVSDSCQLCSRCILDNNCSHLDYSTRYSANIYSVSSVDRNYNSVMSDRSSDDERRSRREKSARRARTQRDSRADDGRRTDGRPSSLHRHSASAATFPVPYEGARGDGILLVPSAGARDASTLSVPSTAPATDTSRDRYPTGTLVPCRYPDAGRRRRTRRRASVKRPPRVHTPDEYEPFLDVDHGPFRRGEGYTPRRCRLCCDPHGPGYVFLHRNGLNRHSRREHKAWYRMPDNFVPLPPHLSVADGEDLEHVQARRRREDSPARVGRVRASSPSPLRDEFPSAGTASASGHRRRAWRSCSSPAAAASDAAASTVAAPPQQLPADLLPTVDYVLPELFDVDRMTPDTVDFSDIGAPRQFPLALPDHSVSGSAAVASRPPPSSSSSSGMPEDVPFEVDDLHRETGLVIVGLDRHTDNSSDGSASPRTAALRDRRLEKALNRPNSEQASTPASASSTPMVSSAVPAVTVTAPASQPAVSTTTFSVTAPAFYPAAYNQVYGPVLSSWASTAPGTVTAVTAPPDQIPGPASQAVWVTDPAVQALASQPTVCVARDPSPAVVPTSGYLELVPVSLPPPVPPVVVPAGGNVVPCRAPTSLPPLRMDTLLTAAMSTSIHDVQNVVNGLLAHYSAHHHPETIGIALISVHAGRRASLRQLCQEITQLRLYKDTPTVTYWTASFGHSIRCKTPRIIYISNCLWI